jgi:hypothetical protein
MKITKVEIFNGYTFCDHLITQSDRDAVASLVGTPMRSATRAWAAAQRLYTDSCDYRVRGARIRVTLRTARGDEVTIG